MYYTKKLLNKILKSHLEAFNNYLSFYHPFLEQDLQLESPLPDDFSNLITQLSTNTL